MQIRLGSLAAWLVMLCAVTAAGADDGAYGSFGAGYGFLDRDRGLNDAADLWLGIGMPAPWAHHAVELSLHLARPEHRQRPGRATRAALHLDLLRDFASRQGWTPYALAGAGLARDTAGGGADVRPLLDVGAGVRHALPWWDMTLRAEARASGQFGSDAAPGDSLLLDYQLRIGVQRAIRPLRRGAGWDAAAAWPAAHACPVAVVDPITGRSECTTDSDGDGVPDDFDACPDTPAAAAVDARGCPLAVAVDGDRDGDGVADAIDLCPASMRGVIVDARGCAEPQPLVLADFTFDFDSARLTALGRLYLDTMALMLLGQPGLDVEIVGHSDSLGAELYNLRLSQARAAAAAAYLAERGVEPERLIAVGRGDAQPVASNASEAGRARNRRVAFWLHPR